MAYVPKPEFGMKILKMTPPEKAVPSLLYPLQRKSNGLSEVLIVFRGLPLGVVIIRKT